MTPNQLKQLIQEIIATTVDEMHDSHEVSDDQNIVTISGIQLPDGRVIDADIGIVGSWDDGAFSYAYGSEKGVHRPGLQFEIQRHAVERAWDSQSQQPVQLSPDIVKIIEAEFGQIESDVEQEISANPPSDDGDPGPASGLD